MNDFETPQGESSPSETTRELRSKGPQGRTSESPASLMSELTQWAEYWATAKAHNDGDRGWNSAAEEVLSMIRKARPTHETSDPRGYVLIPAAVQFLIEAADKAGVEHVTFGVMDPKAGLHPDLPGYIGIIREDVSKLRDSLKASDDLIRRPTGQCSWGCYYSDNGRLVRDSACTVHGASSQSEVEPR